MSFGYLEDGDLVSPMPVAAIEGLVVEIPET